MLTDIFQRLLVAYGTQGWWPVSGRFQPKLEIIIGAILTQNTNWGNVEKALERMVEQGLTTVETILLTGEGQMEEAIRSSGFYRQKAQRLRELLEQAQLAGGMDHFLETVTREHLLELNGIGPETADSILLYAAGRPEMVVDSYTKRILGRVGLLAGNQTYAQVKQFLENGLERDAGLYKEFHALMVRLAKEQCRTVPVCAGCPLRGRCSFAQSQWILAGPLPKVRLPLGKMLK